MVVFHDYRLHDKAGAVRAAEQCAAEDDAVENDRVLRAMRAAVKNDPPDITFDF
jgi:hypothetical protein